MGDCVYFGGWGDYTFFCLNATTGGQVWNYTVGSYIGSPSAVANGYVYFGSLNQHFYCLNATDGKQVWNYTAGDYIQSSSAIVNDRVYFSSDDHDIYCLNASTGGRSGITPQRLG